jgi:hypothetical protein
LTRTERDELLTLIEEIVDWNISSLHMLVTSRKEQEIEDCLKGRVSYDINIQSNLIAADIQTYIRDRLVNDPRLQKWPEKFRVEIGAALMEGSHGM